VSRENGALDFFGAENAHDVEAADVDESASPSRPTTFVLVHGEWGSGDEFGAVAEILRAKGQLPPQWP
jgi:hypothetical protein